MVDAYKSRTISLGKAAEFLMIDKSDFLQRFTDVIEEVEIDEVAAE